MKESSWDIEELSTLVSDIDFDSKGVANWSTYTDSNGNTVSDGKGGVAAAQFTVKF